jgi:hypothetical protein
MSHTTVLKTIQIKNITALQEAVDYLKSQGVNCELVKDAKPRMYYPDQVGKCDYVIKLKDCVYDVGFEKQKDGSYAPMFDSWGGHVQKFIGQPASCPVPTTQEEKQAATISRLLDCYAIHAAKGELENTGTYYSYEVAYSEADGSYTLEAEECGY